MEVEEKIIDVELQNLEATEQEEKQLEELETKKESSEEDKQLVNLIHTEVLIVWLKCDISSDDMTSLDDKLIKILEKYDLSFDWISKFAPELMYITALWKIISKKLNQQQTEKDVIEEKKEEKEVIIEDDKQATETFSFAN